MCISKVSNQLKIFSTVLWKPSTCLDFNVPMIHIIKVSEQVINDNMLKKKKQKDQLFRQVVTKNRALIMRGPT